MAWPQNAYLFAFGHRFQKEGEAAERRAPQSGPVSV